jgi:hypothetical protein
VLNARAIAVQGLGFGPLLTGVQGFRPIAEQQTSGGTVSGWVFNPAEARRYRKKIEDELREEPTPEVIAKAAQAFTADLPKDTRLEDAQLEVTRQIQAFTTLSAMLEALIASEVAKAIYMRQKQDDELVAMLLFARRDPQSILAAITLLE